MAQIIFAAYLSAFMVFGPVVCCCSTASFFGGETAEAHASHGACRSGCHRRNPTANSRHDGSLSTRDAEAALQPPPDNRQSQQCPCKQNTPCMAAVQVGEKSCQRLFDPTELCCAPWLDSHSQLALATLHALKSNSFELRPAVLSGRAILRACHKLQC